MNNHARLRAFLRVAQWGLPVTRPVLAPQQVRIASPACARQRAALITAAALSLSACAQMPADRGWSQVQALDARLSRPSLLSNNDSASAAEAQRLLSEPLDAERAVSVAFLRNPSLRLRYAELGLAQADVIDASRLTNPSLTFSALKPDTDGQRTRYGYGLAQDFADVLFLPLRKRAAAAQLDSAQRRIVAQLQALYAETADAQAQAMAAEQQRRMRELIARQTAASAELARRMKAAGNLNDLQLQREQAAETQAQIDLDEARATETTARAKLNRLMGLRDMEAQWRLPERYTLPVPQEDELETLQQLARAQRPDLAAQQREIAAVESTLTLAQRLRWLPLLQVGVQGERDTDGTHLLGPSVSLQLPLFNQGQGSVLRTQAQLEASRAQLSALELDADNAIAAAHRQLMAARSRVERHRNALIPQREAVVARMQEMQSAMLVGQFELLSARQDEYRAYAGYIDALRDYWQARIALSREIGAALPSDARASSDIATLPDPDASSNTSATAKPLDCDMEHMDMSNMTMDEHMAIMKACETQGAAQPGAQP